MSVINKFCPLGSTHGIIITVVGNEHGGQSSNPQEDMNPTILLNSGVDCVL